MKGNRLLFPYFELREISRMLSEQVKALNDGAASRAVSESLPATLSLQQRVLSLEADHWDREPRTLAAKNSPNGPP